MRPDAKFINIFKLRGRAFAYQQLNSSKISIVAFVNSLTN